MVVVFPLPAAGEQQQAGGPAEEPFEFGAARSSSRVRRAFSPTPPRRAGGRFLPGDRWVGGDPDVAARLEVRLVNPAVLRKESW